MTLTPALSLQLRFRALGTPNRPSQLQFLVMPLSSHDTWVRHLLLHSNPDEEDYGLGEFLSVSWHAGPDISAPSCQLLPRPLQHPELSGTHSPTCALPSFPRIPPSSRLTLITRTTPNISAAGSHTLPRSHHTPAWTWYILWYISCLHISALLIGPNISTGN